ncbi:hypothetical protein KQX54_001438 [Cotesia glomerata]|uniref:Uncharacterized protein n=1 Tax=Cotesia glomerata TaxID=32391 RepID=A0AAV7J3M7_COTGL|nr:hypothetical protein KQX54_001438 [Cotesia glomerata]
MVIFLATRRPRDQERLMLFPRVRLPTARPVVTISVGATTSSSTTSSESSRNVFTVKLNNKTTTRRHLHAAGGIQGHRYQQQQQQHLHRLVRCRRRARGRWFKRFLA